MFYLFSILILNIHAVAYVFQPEADHLVVHMLSIGKFWLFVIPMSLFALIPDFILNAGFFIFKPNPDDEFLKLERQKVHNKIGSMELPKLNFHFNGYVHHMG